MPCKTFHFEGNFDDAHLVLFGAYMQSSALCEALRGIVEGAGQEVPWADVQLKKLDLVVAKLLRAANAD